MISSTILAKMGLMVAAAACVATSASLPPISAVGSKFYDDTGKQFFLKGIAYQLIIDDPLIDTAQCKRDAALMKTLGANTIRVYHVDPNANHDGCMSAFADAGIYLLVDLDTFDTQIEPDRGPVWTTSQYDAFAKVFDAFHSYTNTLGVFIGNEVIAKANQSEAAPFIKAAARDMKAYRDKQGYRKIPVGYSAADIAELRPMLQNYLTCGGDEANAIDFFGLNAYEWCGDVNFKTSGYSTLNDQANDFPVPIFFSETGCNTNPPRTFGDQAAILGSDMNSIWSGTIVYEWIEETNNYGLISYAAPLPKTVTASGVYDGFVRSGTPTPKQPDFSNLQAVWKTLNPTGIPSSKYTPAITSPSCPASTKGGWLVNGDVRLPTINQALVHSADATGTASSTATPTSEATSSPTASKTGAAGLGREITGMSIALVVVMLGFVIML